MTWARGVFWACLVSLSLLMMDVHGRKLMLNHCLLFSNNSRSLQEKCFLRASGCWELLCKHRESFSKLKFDPPVHLFLSGFWQWGVYSPPPPAELSLNSVSKLETFSLGETSLSSNHLTMETTVLLNNAFNTLRQDGLLSLPYCWARAPDSVYIIVIPDSKSLSYWESRAGVHLLWCRDLASFVFCWNLLAWWTARIAGRQKQTPKKQKPFLWLHSVSYLPK